MTKGKATIFKPRFQPGEQVAVLTYAGGDQSTSMDSGWTVVFPLRIKWVNADAMADAGDEPTIAVQYYLEYPGSDLIDLGEIDEANVFATPEEAAVVGKKRHGSFD